MREVEFRAWDTEEKVMIYNVEQTYDDNCRGKGGCYGDCCFGEVLEDSRYILEQYIGKKDMNRKKVFEGDILKGYYYPFMKTENYLEDENHKVVCIETLKEAEFNYLLEICWDSVNASFFGCIHKAKNAPISGISNLVTESIEDIDFSQMEVVGNIHKDGALVEYPENLGDD